MTQDFDILIVGAGPAGLTLARALSGQGLHIGVLEQQPQSAVAHPAFDGREIALTQRSAHAMQEWGLWQRIEELEPTAFSALRDAQVLNGSHPFAMVIGHELSSRSELGWLVSNHLIRQAAWDTVQLAIEAHHDIELFCECRISRVRSNDTHAEVTCEDGRVLRSRLLIAADSRFSQTRRAMGIAADMHDFGRTMLVCNMTHERAHEHVAWEWFDYGQTLALLPMNDDPVTGMHRSSVVLTLPSRDMDGVLDMEDNVFNSDMTRRFAGRLGAMTLTSTRHAYPLVGVYPRHLVAQRFACIGDAAVGMHPVTAHGFNFGLLGIETLSQALIQAHAQGRDIGHPALLARYERTHMLSTRPLYLATQAIVKLYTFEHPVARLVRDGMLRLGQRITPFRRAIAAQLTGLH